MRVVTPPCAYQQPKPSVGAKAAPGGEGVSPGKGLACTREGLGASEDKAEEQRRFICKEKILKISNTDHKDKICSI